MKHNTDCYDRLAYCLKRKPVITSLVHQEELSSILQTSSNIVFILRSDIFTIETFVEQIRDAGKLSFVHFDLIDGIGKDRTGVEFLADKIGIDGIVTTKSLIISEAKKKGLMTVQRLFVFDSVSLDNGIKMARTAKPDAIEVLPGMVCTRIMKRVQEELNIPIIAGGLMTDLTDLETALDNGVIGISTSSKELWNWQDESGCRGQ